MTTENEKGLCIPCEYDSKVSKLFKKGVIFRITIANNQKLHKSVNTFFMGLTPRISVHFY